MKGTDVCVVLLTDDLGSRELAAAASCNDLYEAKHVRAYIQELELGDVEAIVSSAVVRYY